MNSKIKVLMVVYNSVLDDNRVLKTAQSISSLGCEVLLVGISKDYRETTLNNNGFTIKLLPNSTLAFKQGLDKALRQDLILDSFTYKVKELSKYFSPDILHTHDMYGLIIGNKFYLNAHTLHQKTIAWVHDIHEYVNGLTIIPEDLRMYALTNERRHIHKPDYLITVSDPLAEALQKDYSLNTPPYVIMNVPFFNSFDKGYVTPVRKALKIPKNEPLMVYSGQAKPARGLEELVEILPHFSQLHAVIITNNKGSYIDKIKSDAVRLHCHKRLHFHPYVNPTDVPSFIQDATFGVFPLRSYGNADVALPNKLFDYLHARLPVVVSNTIAMANFVKKYNLGKVYNVGSKTDFISAVGALLSNLDEYKSRINQSGELLKKYSWEYQSQILNKLYLEIIKNRVE